MRRYRKFGRRMMRRFHRGRKFRSIRRYSVGLGGVRF